MAVYTCASGTAEWTRKRSSSTSVANIRGAAQSDRRPPLPMVGGVNKTT